MRRFSYAELATRDKLNLNFDLFWLKDDSLPAADVLAAEIVEKLRAALARVRNVTQELDDNPD